MIIEKFLLDNVLPKRHDNSNFVLFDAFVAEKDTFFEMYENCVKEGKCLEKNDIYDKLSDIKMNVEENFASIEHILRHYENGNPKKAQIEFDKLMDRLGNDLFLGTIEGYEELRDGNWQLLRKISGKEFYRIRSVESRSEKIENNAYELFHIPSLFRQNASNLRFNLAGFPSLYLASNLPLAWQECGYPSMYYYSKYTCQADESRYLSLYSPQEIQLWGIAAKYNCTEVWSDVVLRYIKMFPLILACSFVNEQGNAVFKQEYIIPQMLMQWVQRNSDKVKGITYFSCVDTTAFTSEWCGYNVALPAFLPFDDKGYSKELKNMFCWSKPTFYQVPITVSSVAEHDYKQANNVIAKIQKWIRSQTDYRLVYNDVKEMLDLSCSLLVLIKHGKTTDLDTIVVTLQTLQTFYNKIVNKIGKDLSNYITTNLKDNSTTENQCEDFESLKSSFISIWENFKGLEEIIEKNLVRTWNGCHDETYVWIYYTHCEEYDYESILKSFDENHILYTAIELEDNNSFDRTVQQWTEKYEVLRKEIERVSGKSKMIKAIDAISLNKPIFLILHSASIYSDNNKEDALLVGADTEQVLKYI